VQLAALDQADQPHAPRLDQLDLHVRVRAPIAGQEAGDDAPENLGCRAEAKDSGPSSLERPGALPEGLDVGQRVASPPERAARLMRAAADSEDGSVKHVAMENRLYPMRELLGDLLLERGHAASALREYEASLKENPNRYRGLCGAARAAEALGDRQKAAEYFERTVALSENADSPRPEVARAKAFLGKR
jgi:tetratricopeptide (TPR) repeat protein